MLQIITAMFDGAIPAHAERRTGLPFHYGRARCIALLDVHGAGTKAVSGLPRFRWRA
jgi:hypothetical protein